MAEIEVCKICGISNEYRKIIDALTVNGIARVCEDCAFCLNLPIVGKPTQEQLDKAAGVGVSVYERLAKDRGLDPEEHKKRAAKFNEGKINRVETRDLYLKDMARKSVDSNILNAQPVKRADIINHYHWDLLKARRMKKMSIQQLAKELNEKEMTLQLAERGVLPENDNYALAIKLENFFGINIINKNIIMTDLQKKELALDMDNTSGDYVEIKVKKEPFFKRIFGKLKNSENSKEDVKGEIVTNKTYDYDTPISKKREDESEEIKE